MNQLTTEARAKIIGCLVEGCSQRATTRLTGAAKKTVSRLAQEMGEACQAPVSALARFFDVGVETMRDAINRKTWRHVA